MINIILKLSLVNDMIDLLADTLNSTIWANLTDNELIEPALSELKTLVNLLTRIGNDIFKLEWS